MALLVQFAWLVRIGRPYCASKPLQEASKPLQDAKLIEKRRIFMEQERAREAEVREDMLTARERRIRRLHNEAVERGHFTYDDEESSKREFTRLRHYLRGACCGNACRHCIYDHVKVAAGKIKNKRFNSSFWVYNEADPDDISDEYMMSLRHPKIRPKPS